MARNKLAGQPRPQHVKDKISRSQQERYRRIREGSGFPDRKRCSRCGEWKDSPTEFGWTRRKLKDGTYAYHPRSQCKECGKKRAREYREKRGNEENKRRQKIYNERRKKKGIDMNPFFPAEPLRDWILAQPELVLDKHSSLDRRRRAIVTQESKRVRLSTIDALLAVYGKPEAFHEIYPG